MDFRAHKLALWAGCLLLLLAAGMLVKNESFAQSGWSDQRLRVVDALAESAPCLTCHSTVADASRLIAVTGPRDAAARPVDASTRPIHIEPNTKIENAHVHDELSEIGSRLLAVEARDLGQYTAAVDQFVTASNALNAASTSASLTGGLHALEVAEHLVTMLEHQASPVQLRASTAGPTEDVPIQANSLTGPPAPAALAALLLGLAPASTVLRRRDSEPVISPVRIVCGTRRRGPPVGEAVLSVGD